MIFEEHIGGVNRPEPENLNEVIKKVSSSIRVGDDPKVYPIVEQDGASGRVEVSSPEEGVFKVRESTDLSSHGAILSNKQTTFTVQDGLIAHASFAITPVIDGVKSRNTQTYTFDGSSYHHQKNREEIPDNPAILREGVTKELEHTLAILSDQL